MKSVPTKSSEGLLTLQAVRGIGPATADKLARRFLTLGEIIEASERQLSTIVTNSILENLRAPEAIQKAWDVARKIHDMADNLGVVIWSIHDQSYPKLLSKIPDPPPVLYVKGSLESERTVACIGTREPSEFGAEVTRRIVEQLVDRHWTIVSGLAIGVDTLSHRAALDFNGTTVAVLANGLDAVYPKQNSKLAGEILDRGGALISEQPFGAPATPRNLVQRDRLQSGLSIATIVMQTDIKGGSMHTVRFTLEQGRMLFAPVPQGRHAEEAKSQGILALTQLAGSEFAKVFGANVEYERLINKNFYNRPLATAIRGREDYEAILRNLESHIEGADDRQNNFEPQARFL